MFPPFIEAPGPFIGITLILGGLGAFASGWSLARQWRGAIWVALAGLPLAFAVCFLHWSLFQEPFALAPAVLDYAWICFIGGGAYIMARHRLRRQQYPWLFS